MRRLSTSSSVFHTDEERMIQSTTRRFASEVIAPRVGEMEKAKKICPEILRGLHENGLLSIEVEEKYGGANGSFVASCLAIEEIAKVDPSVAVLVDIQNTLVNRALSKYATPAQREEWLPRLSSDTVGSFCLSEPNSGSDAFALRCFAVEDAEGFSITGEKSWISNSAEAGLFLLFATVDPSAGRDGVRCFLIPRETPGVSVGPPEDKLGIRASSTCSVVLSDVRVPKEAMIEGGYKIAIETLNEGRIGIGAQMVGLAAGALESTLPYLRERRQFGKPVIDNQGLQFQIAQAATELQVARAFVYDVARLKTEGQPFVKEAAMAKLFSSQVAERISSRCVEWLGGIGFVTGAYPAEKFYRDAKIGAIYEGTSNIQLATIAKYYLSQQQT